MLVKMKRTQTGSPNGIKIVNYEAGKEYDLEDDLYDVFVNQMKIAESVNPVEEDKMVTPPNNKAMEPETDKKDKKDKKNKSKKDKDDEPETEEEIEEGSPFNPEE